MSRSVKRWLFLILLSFPIAGFAQKEALIKKPDSLSGKEQRAEQINEINPDYYSTYVNLLNFNSYVSLLGYNAKQEITKPFHMTKKEWGSFGKFAVIAVGLGFADELVQQAALKLRNRNTGLNNVSKYVTKFGASYEVITLAGLGIYGLVFKNEKLTTTTLLATQSCITATSVTSVLKFITGRTRPSYYNANEEAEPRFLGPFSKATRDANGKKISTSFPSGHTTVAFAAATVFASEYRNKAIVPIIAYSAASLVGVSRITENKHWATDVFVGAAIGFITGKQVVNNYQHYSKIKSEEKQKILYSFSLNYFYGHCEPELLLHFK